MNKRNFGKSIFVFLSGLFVILAFCGCGNPDIDISKYEDSVVVFSGLTDKNIKITVKELKAMDCVTVKTKSTSDKIGEIKATGPLLDTVLDAYDAEKQDFRIINIYGSDKYKISLTESFFGENDLILAFGIDEKPLDKGTRPIRLIIPGSDSAYWVRLVNRIEFIR